MHFGRQRIRDRQAANPGARRIEKLKRTAGKDQSRDGDVGIGRDVQGHLTPLATFLPGFGDQPGQIGLGKPQFAGADLASFNEPPLAPISRVGP
jgi:hypothetical protein